MPSARDTGLGNGKNNIITSDRLATNLGHTITKKRASFIILINFVHLGYDKKVAVGIIKHNLTTNIVLP